MLDVAGLTQNPAFNAPTFAAVMCHDYPRAFRYQDPPPVPGRAAVSAAQLPPARAAATPTVRRALGLVGATAEDLAQQNGVVHAWGAANGLRGGRYAADTATPGAITLTAVRVVRDASVSGTLAPGAGQQLTGTLLLSGPGVAPGRLQVRIALGTGAGHATGTLSGHAVDLDFQLEGGR